MLSVNRCSALPRVCLALLIGVILIAPLGIGVIFLVERVILSNWARRADPFPPPPNQRLVYFHEGLATPKTFPAGQAILDDDEPVVGIEVGGKARAYSLRAMRGKTRHIINDMIGGFAITVTHCNLSGCNRAFGGEARPTPLDIAQGGLLDGQMVLRVGGAAYLQETGEVIKQDDGQPTPPFPYAPYPLTLTTWGDWKSHHPETDVFTGLPSRSLSHSHAATP